MLIRIVLMALTVLLSGCATIEDLDEVENAATAPGLSPRQCVLHKRAIEWLNDRYPFESIFSVYCDHPEAVTFSKDFVHKNWTTTDMLTLMGRPYVGFRCLTIRDVTDGLLRQMQQDHKKKGFECKVSYKQWPATLADPDTVTDAEILAEAIEIGTMLGPLPGAVPGGVKIPVFCPLSSGCPDDPSSPFEPQEPGSPDEGDW